MKINGVGVCRRLGRCGEDLRIPSTLLEISTAIRLRKIARMNFYRRLQGIYRERSKVDFRRLKVKKRWESGNEG